MLRTWGIACAEIIGDIERNTSYLVARQEASLVNCAKFHVEIDEEFDHLQELLSRQRKSYHEKIETASKKELDSLKDYLDLLEASLNFFHDFCRKLESCHYESSNVDEQDIGVQDLFQSARNHFGSVQANLAGVIMTSFDPVTLRRHNNELCEIFTVESKHMFASPIARVDDAMMKMMSMFERLNTCPECFQLIQGNTVEEEINTTAPSLAVMDDTQTMTTCPEVTSTWCSVMSNESTCAGCGARLACQVPQVAISIDKSSGIPECSWPRPQLFNQPHGVALVTTSTSKLLFVSDTGNSKIEVYNSETREHVRTVRGDRGSALDQFLSPHGLASLVDIAANLLLLFVVDVGNKRVKIVDLLDNDAVRGVVAIDGVPRGLAVHATRLYVVEITKHRVLVFDINTLALVNEIGQAGSEAGQLNDPRGLAWLSPHSTATRESRLFVCDGGNHRIQVFDVNSNRSLLTFGKGAFSFPMGITISSLNEYYGHIAIVSDHKGERLVLFDAITGMCLRTLGHDMT